MIHPLIDYAVGRGLSQHVLGRLGEEFHKLFPEGTAEYHDAGDFRDRLMSEINSFPPIVELRRKQRQILEQVEKVRPQLEERLGLR